MFRKIFRDHPADVGETYAQHFLSAASFSLAMFLGAIACLVHALVPALCVKTGSGIIKRLHNRMVTNRHAR